MSPRQVVVIDCRAHLLGRLASVIAKEILSGQKVVCTCSHLSMRLQDCRSWRFQRSKAFWGAHQPPADVSHCAESGYGGLQVAVRTEEINISGGLVRQHMKYDRFLEKRMVTNPRKGPYHFRAPAKILWRTIRG